MTFDPQAQRSTFWQRGHSFSKFRRAKHFIPDRHKRLFAAPKRRNPPPIRRVSVRAAECYTALSDQVKTEYNFTFTFSIEVLSSPWEVQLLTADNNVTTNKAVQSTNAHNCSLNDIPVTTSISQDVDHRPPYTGGGERAYFSCTEMT